MRPYQYNHYTTITEAYYRQGCTEGGLSEAWPVCWDANWGRFVKENTTLPRARMPRENADSHITRNERSLISPHGANLFI